MLRPSPRIPRPGYLLIAGVALCWGNGAAATDKRALSLTATVVPPTECRLDRAGPACQKGRPSPVRFAGLGPDSRFEGQVRIRTSHNAATLDSRGMVATTPEIVLTLAP